MMESIQLNDSLVEKRSEQIHNIERGVTQISELFQDLSILVTTQGNQIDNIEGSVKTSGLNEYVEWNKDISYLIGKKIKFHYIFLKTELYSFIMK